MTQKKTMVSREALLVIYDLLHELSLKGGMIRSIDFIEYLSRTKSNKNEPSFEAKKRRFERVKVSMRNLGIIYHTESDWVRSSSDRCYYFVVPDCQDQLKKVTALLDGAINKRRIKLPEEEAEGDIMAKRGNVTVQFQTGKKGQPPPLEKTLVSAVLDWLCDQRGIQEGVFRLSWGKAKRPVTGITGELVILDVKAKLDNDGLVLIEVYSTESKGFHSVYLRVPYKPEKRERLFMTLKTNSGSEDDQEDPAADFEPPEKDDLSPLVLRCEREQGVWSSSLFTVETKASAYLSTELDGKRDDLRKSRPNHVSKGLHLQRVLACVVEDLFFQLGHETDINLNFEHEDELFEVKESPHRFKLHRVEGDCILIQVDGYWIWIGGDDDPQALFEKLEALYNGEWEGEEENPEPDPADESVTPEVAPKATPVVASKVCLVAAPVQEPVVAQPAALIEESIVAVVKQLLASAGLTEDVTVKTVATVPYCTSSSKVVQVLSVSAPVLTMELLVPGKKNRQLVEVSVTLTDIAAKLEQALRQSGG